MNSNRLNCLSNATLWIWWWPQLVWQSPSLEFGRRGNKQICKSIRPPPFPPNTQSESRQSLRSSHLVNCCFNSFFQNRVITALLEKMNQRSGQLLLIYHDSVERRSEIQSAVLFIQAHVRLLCVCVPACGHFECVALTDSGHWKYPVLILPECLLFLFTHKDIHLAIKDFDR